MNILLRWVFSMSSIKKVVLTFVVIVVLAGICYGLYSQVIVPTAFEATEVEVDDLEKTDEFVTTFAKECDAGMRPDTDYPVSYSGKLPSDNPTDYKIAYCYFKGVNRSFLDNYNVLADFGDASKYKENIIFACNSDAASCMRLSRRDERGAKVILVLYTGNLSEAQIRELIQSVTFTVKAKGDFTGTRSQTISYKMCDKIEFVPVSEE